MKKEEKVLMDLDAQFCKDAHELGSVGWSKYLSKNALMGTSKHEPYIEGKKTICNLVGMIYLLDNIDFTWKPEHAFVSDDHTLGVTTGMYTRRYSIEEELFEEIGKYVTTWKKEDQKWKIIFDMGN